jgi:hypothetical protein
MLSGTSMATPYVAGAAALAWAYDPTATLEEVRNALLQGVDHLSTLNGKVASGGRLDVLQTLKLLGAAPVAPTIGSLAVSANNVTAGASVKLVAAGATATSGSVTAVYFYADSNNNGVYDSTDTLIGTNNVVSGGSASLQLNTTGMSAGTYRYFARALGSNNQLSNAVSTTLTIAAGYSQNTTPSTPTIVVGAKLAGKIDTGGKECLYQFQAVAGTTYTIRTELVTLRDSVLYLYGTDGKTKLAFNDDGDSGMASRIIWTAPQSGTYYFKVAGFSKSLTGDFKVSLAANTTTASSAGVASLRSCSGETGVFASSNTIISPATSANFAQSANLASRLSANTVISDASALSGMRTVAPIYGATSTIISGTLFTGDLPAAQNDTISSTGRSEERTTSLLDSNPALRSVLGSMFFEEEPDAAATAESTDIDLDALDTLFAQLTEGDFGGNG